MNVDCYLLIIKGAEDSDCVLCYYSALLFMMDSSTLQLFLFVSKTSNVKWNFFKRNVLNTYIHESNCVD